MMTNALGPMRRVEALADLVSPNGVIGVMSSGLGSIAGPGTQTSDATLPFPGVRQAHQETVWPRPAPPRWGEVAGERRSPWTVFVRH